MITALYASICALILIILSLNVIKLRRGEQVSLGDGEVQALKVAIAAHSNASQYIPIALLLIFMLEYNGAFAVLVHLAGIMLIAGRILHARGITTAFKGRVLGMQITIWTILSLAIANVLLVTYMQFFA